MKLNLNNAQIETIAETLTNLSTIWWAALLTAPGFTHISSINDILVILWNNLPPAIICFLIASKLREEVKR